MNFAELRFWGLLLGGLAAILAARAVWRRFAPNSLVTFDRVTLVLLGWTMLLAVSVETFCIFLIVKISTFVGLKFILTRVRGRRRYLGVLIPWVLLPLFYYKYSRFVAADVLGLKWDTWNDLVIPIGISFYTFQAVAFLVDTLAFRQPLPRFLDFMNFAGFFPQIVAGPIERRNDLLPQMENFRWRWLPAEIDRGVSWIVVGLFLKMALADNLAEYFFPESATNAFSIWMANVVFGLRIYFDFAGYSLVALGLARCLGVSLTLNFASPYCSGNVTEFWRRWHITLSQWFRDYVYVPLGGGRTPRWWINVLIVFIVSGVWHGAGWNFILWGALHGLFLIIHRLAARRLRMPAPMGWFLTMVGAFFAWLCFYETRTHILWQKLATLVNPLAYNSAALREAALTYQSGQGLVLLGFLVIAVITLVLEWRSLVHKDPYQYLRRPAVLAVLVVLTVLLAPAKDNAFIYFAF